MHETNNMHEINKMLEEIVKELWDIKRFKSKITLNDITDFYREYQFHANLAIDIINEQIRQYTDMSSPLQYSKEEISYLVDSFKVFNKNNYDKLIVESLCLLNSEQSYQYLNQILDTEEKTRKFEQDFSHFSMNTLLTNLKVLNDF